MTVTCPRCGPVHVHPDTRAFTETLRPRVDHLPGGGHFILNSAEPVT